MSGQVLLIVLWKRVPVSMVIEKGSVTILNTDGKVRYECPLGTSIHMNVSIHNHIHVIFTWTVDGVEYDLELIFKNNDFVNFVHYVEKATKVANVLLSTDHVSEKELKTQPLLNEINRESKDLPDKFKIIAWLVLWMFYCCKDKIPLTVGHSKFMGALFNFKPGHHIDNGASVVYHIVNGVVTVLGVFGNTRPLFFKNGDDVPELSGDDLRALNYLFNILFWTRHGHSLQNAHTDVTRTQGVGLLDFGWHQIMRLYERNGGLSDKGRAEIQESAKKLHAIFPPEKFRVSCSGMQRALETASVFQIGACIEQEPEQEPEPEK